LKLFNVIKSKKSQIADTVQKLILRNTAAKKL